MGASQYQPSVTPELSALNKMATQKAATTRWRCREPSRQLYIGARVLRVLSLEPFIRFSSETLTSPYFACQLN